MLYGKSSAFGGETFHQETNPKTVGLALEYGSVCQLMNAMKANDNLNNKTQVIGLVIGERDDVFPIGGGDKCLYSEWFDFNTPNNNDGDEELHGAHFNRLQDSVTGEFRICSKELVVTSEFEGGSEFTEVEAHHASEGHALGDDGVQFGQKLTGGNVDSGGVGKDEKIICKDVDQDIEKLPKPFIFGEGIKGNSKKNATCLDYKAR